MPCSVSIYCLSSKVCASKSVMALNVDLELIVVNVVAVKNCEVFTSDVCEAYSDLACGGC